MKNYFHSALAIILAILVLHSTFSFAIEKHYCGGEVVDTSYLGMVERCLDGTSEVEDLNAMNCCKDVQHLVDASNDELVPGISYDLDMQQFLQLFGYSYLQLFEEFSTKLPHAQNYYSPHVVKDIPVLYESFLI